MIRLSKSTITKKDLNSVNKVLKKEYLGMGKEVKLFEDRLTKFFKMSNITYLIQPRPHTKSGI